MNPDEKLYVKKLVTKLTITSIALHIVYKTFKYIGLNDMIHNIIKEDENKK